MEMGGGGSSYKLVYGDMLLDKGARSGSIRTMAPLFFAFNPHSTKP